MIEFPPYQQEGSAFMAARKTSFLADDPGLGKSAQAIDATRRIDASSATVICPAALVANWRHEFDKFYPERKNSFKLEVMSYERAGRSLKGNVENADVLILDEGQYLKNREAQRTKYIYGAKCERDASSIAARMGRVFVLSGTPAPNNYSELWTHLRALAPDLIWDAKRDQPASFWGFTKRYCVVREISGIPSIIGSKPEKAAELRKILAPWMLRRRVDEVLGQLPDFRIQQLFIRGAIPYAPEYAKFAAAVERGGMEELRKAAGSMATLRRAVGVAKIKETKDWVFNFLESTDEKIVLIGVHTEVLEALRVGISGKTKVAYLDGSTTDRDAPVRMFQTDPSCRVFIGQIIPAGVGHTLTAASKMLIVESSWTPADNYQAAKRIHRIGQKQNCIVWFVTVEGSIDEIVSRVVARKTAEIAALMD